VSDTKRTERLRSSRLEGEEVLCARWGFYGTPVLLFPTAGGDAEECERMQMILALRPLLDAGRVKVYSCDSVGGRALTRRRDHPPGYYPRVQTRFDAFVHDELVPWIRADCESKDIGVVTAGASIGAFNAVAALCRHPETFTKAIGMSGTYDLSKWLAPEDLGADFHFSSPVHFLPGLGEGETLRRLRTRFALLATGQGAWEDPAQSWLVAKALGAKGVPNRVDAWGTEWRHDWVTWREMLPRYLGELA
jgi:esterase/lipase superfamily enzyme